MKPEQAADFNDFKTIMLKQLEDNEWKDGWEECEISFLVEQFRNKVFTLNSIWDASIIQSLDKYPNLQTTMEASQKLLADLANYSMMISGNIGRSI